MNEHTIPFEELIRKRDSGRCCPVLEQEPKSKRLLLYLCALARPIKALYCFIGIVLKAVISTCLSIAKLILCLIALMILLAVL